MSLPETLIIHKSPDQRKRGVEFWTGRNWTTVRSFAKTYVHTDALEILHARFHDDLTAKIVCCTQRSISL